ncbi:ExeA family protein [Parvularcula sp. LCG005]|uniref:ExeA family protein n=1 Tax=Parvularcula sp. LCG005 TaxID=3078805 RepID=UPI002942D4EB|nr:AAA family ATPase [Parvularcula sp. LCG005]WOI53317.1 AAA family ATPase [Parvularcula sp. LCG005]
MYEEHFQLTRKPFAAYPEPEMMFWGEGHKMARTMLVYGLTATNGIVVITGEIGSGKTTLLNHIMSQDQSGHILGRLNGAVGLSDDVAAWVLFGFGMDASDGSRTENVSRLRDFLKKAYERRRKAVLFIDEAQLLPEAAIEELRLLADMQINGTPVLQLVLLGQPELARILNQPHLLQFRQRIVSHYHLKAFAPEETIDYVLSRIEKAGGHPELITAEALDLIYSRTDGVPRRINILCDTAFVYAYAQGEAQVTADTISKVMSDRQNHGLLEIN